MSEIITSYKHDASDDAFHIIGVQDVEPYLEENARRREITARGDFKFKWNLPNIMIEKFYFEYTGGTFRPMNEEFYRWVDKKIMSDPDLKYFRTNNPSNPFWTGYGSR